LRELTAAPRAALNDTNRLSQLARDLLLLARSADDDIYIDARAEGVDHVPAAVASYDVHRAHLMGRIAPSTGIAPLGPSGCSG
jgi:hypothetical protein